jgi:hypothetical protein
VVNTTVDSVVVLLALVVVPATVVDVEVDVAVVVDDVGPVVVGAAGFTTVKPATASSRVLWA